MRASVHHHQHHQQQRDQHRRRAPPEVARLMKPDGRRDGVEHAGGDHRVGSAESIEERNQHQASGGRARQIEEIGAIHALDGFRHGDRNHRPGQKERQRAGDVNRGQRASSRVRSDATG